MTAKEQIAQWLNAMPDDYSLEQIHYRLYFCMQVERGLKAAAEGDVVSHEEAKQRIGEWLSSFGQPQR